MHLVCLGVMKKLIKLWIRGKKNVRMSERCQIDASNQLLLLSKFIPNEFSRRPRSLEYFYQFKATELRQILLYTGPLIFQRNLSRDRYYHFMSLSIAIRILASEKFHNKWNSYAKQLLKYFVTNFAKLYGPEHLSYNVHNLTHLSDNVKLYGHLDKFSVFKFENYMQQIKKKVKTSSKPLQQFVKRTEEQNALTIKYKKLEYPIKYGKEKELDYDKKCINSLEYEHYILDTKNGNNVCCLTNDSCIEIEKLYLKNNQIYLTGKQYSQKCEFFKIPCNSLIFGIQIVNETVYQSVEIMVQDIKNKCLKFPLQENKSVVFPLIHN